MSSGLYFSVPMQTFTDSIRPYENPQDTKLLQKRYFLFYADICDLVPATTGEKSKSELHFT